MDPKAEALLDKMATSSLDWSDEKLAGRIVELLILDKGLVNAWQRTIETMILLLRKREQLLRERDQ